MTLTAAKSGGWATEDLLSSAQMNALQTELLKAVDGAGGGTYTLSAPLIFTGDDVRLDTDDIDIVSGGELSILSGGLLAVESGGGLQIESGGALDVLSGGAVDLQSGATFDVESGGILNVLSGGEINLNSGGTLTVDGGSLVDVISGSFFTFFTGSQLTINGGAEIQIASSGLVDVVSGGQVDFADVDDLTVNANAVTEVWDGVTMNFNNSIWALLTSGTYRQADTASPFSIFLPIRLQSGDTLNSVTVRVDGAGGGATHVGLPATLPAVEVFRVNSSTGAATSIAGPTTDASASLGAYESDHDITLSSIAETAAGARYFVEIQGESGANAVNDALQLIGVSFGITLNSVRASARVN